MWIMKLMNCRFIFVRKGWRLQSWVKYLRRSRIQMESGFLWKADCYFQNFYFGWGAGDLLRIQWVSEVFLKFSNFLKSVVAEQVARRIIGEFLVSFVPVVISGQLIAVVRKVNYPSITICQNIWPWWCTDVLLLLIKYAPELQKWWCFGCNSLVIPGTMSNFNGIMSSCRNNVQFQRNNVQFPEQCPISTE